MTDRKFLEQPHTLVHNARMDGVDACFIVGVLEDALMRARFARRSEIEELLQDIFNPDSP